MPPTNHAALAREHAAKAREFRSEAEKMHNQAGEKPDPHLWARVTYLLHERADEHAKWSAEHDRLAMIAEPAA